MQYIYVLYNLILLQKDGKTLCPECIDDQKIYGEPKKYATRSPHLSFIIVSLTYYFLGSCEYCNCQAAFFGTKCTICTKQEKVYVQLLTIMYFVVCSSLSNH